MDEIYKDWSSLASHYIGECYDVAKPYIEPDCAGLDPYVRFVIAQLFISCHLSSESALILVRNGKEWDSDVICRSVLEGSIKFVYLLNGDDASRKQRAEEYWELLPSFSAIKRSDRARALLSALENSEDESWRPFWDLIVESEEIETIRSRYNKKQRHIIEQRWSFTDIVKDFSKEDLPGLNLLVHLSHGYVMSSHVLHMDGDGVGMIWERYQRSPENYYAISIAHAARVVSDVCSFSALRLARLLKACGAKIDSIEEIHTRYTDLFADLKEANKYFNAVEYDSKNDV